VDDTVGLSWAIIPKSYGLYGEIVQYDGLEGEGHWREKIRARK
jgi:hypothetical protein